MALPCCQPVEALIGRGYITAMVSSAPSRKSQTPRCWEVGEVKVTVSKLELITKKSFPSQQLDFKGALRSFGENVLTDCLCLNKLNKQTDLKGQHNVILFYFVYMWRTLPPFQLQASGELIFTLRTACLLIYLLFLPH